MIDPVTAAAIAQAAMGAIQKFSSSSKRKNAKKNFQNFKIPQTAYTMLDIAKDTATAREIPGADIYRGRALGSAARAVEAAQRTAEAPSDVLAVLGRAYGRDYMDFEKNLATMSVENQYRGRAAYMSALDRLTALETQKWEMNELAPYMQVMNEAGDLDAAGGANIQGALSTGLSMWNTNQAIEADKAMFEEYKKWKIGSGGGGLMSQNPYGTPAFSTSTPIPKTNFNQQPGMFGETDLPTFDPSVWRYSQQVNRFNNRF